jgi:hypothetical protein
MANVRHTFSRRAALVACAGLIRAATSIAASSAASFDPGQASCPSFIAVKQPSTTAPDMAALEPYRQYLLGFEKGYSWQAPAPIDVFAVLGDPPLDKALDAIAAWCVVNQQGTFADGLKSVVRKMRAAAPAH